MERKTILIADDDPNDAVLIQRVFKQCRILNSLQVLPNGRDVIDYLKGDVPYHDRTAHPLPVLLLLDLKMPNKSGIEVLEWLQSHPTLSGMAIVVLSGAADTKDIDRAYKLGAHSFLMKPLQTEDFMNLINGLKNIRVESQDEGCHLSYC